MMRVAGFPTAAGALDLHVAPGEVVLLRGPNGSGKTSLLRAFAGLSAALVPRAVETEHPAMCPQDPRDALVGLTVSGEFRLRRRAVPLDLSGWHDRDSATLSSGEARRVGIAAAEDPNARLLLLDEPSEGLDEDSRERLVALIRSFRTRGAVIAADHARLLDDVATRIVDLAPTLPAGTFDIPRASGPILLRASATHLRGRALPALALGPGFHVLVGPNGSGKSTLLARLAGLLDADGVDVRGARPRPGDTVRLALPHARDHFTRSSVAEELAAVDIDVARAFVPESLTARHPLAQSGGEAQRLSLAKALGRPATVVLLDEPEAHLDGAGRAALAQVIARRVEEGTCVVAATHDAALIAAAQEVVRF